MSQRALRNMPFPGQSRRLGILREVGRSPAPRATAQKSRENIKTHSKMLAFGWLASKIGGASIGVIAAREMGAPTSIARERALLKNGTKDLLDRGRTRSPC
jgi:hypothetical protein